jgi:hypothetical protein
LDLRETKVRRAFRDQRDLLAQRAGRACLELPVNLERKEKL